MVAIPQREDPTLEALKAIVEREFASKSKDEKRDYLGASAIGDPCARKIWYQLHGYEGEPFKAHTIWGFEDGHKQEDEMARRLRMIPGIELWTHGPNGKQYGFTMMDGKFKGHADGVIRGLLQAPKALHIWENKASGQKKYDEFTKAKNDFGEKNTLEQWNKGYFIQAQLLMHKFQIDRHYCTVELAGGRDVQSCRTEYQPQVAEAAINKADMILSARQEPARVSEKPDFYLCKWCPFREICHGKK